MSWDFETDPEFQQKLDWMDRFVRDQVEPAELLIGYPANVKDPTYIKLIRPLQKRVREEGLWACHLGPELGGKGFGQVKLALMNEIIGRSNVAPSVFGCQAPDSGNAEILARYGSEEQKNRFLKPLLDNEITSCFSMTEPQGGSDPTAFLTSAVRDQDTWRITGEKWFSSNARWAEFLIVMAQTDPSGRPHERASMFIVPIGTPGLEFIRNVSIAGMTDQSEAYLRFNNVAVPHDHMLGEQNRAFAVAQARLGGGRIHHAMRTVGRCQKLLDMMCQRAAARRIKGGLLSESPLAQDTIATSWMELEQYRLLVMRTAWRIDKYNDYRKVIGDIAAVKAAMPKVYHDIASRALHLHGSHGVTDEYPFVKDVVRSFVMGLADGPTEIHKLSLARQILKPYPPSDAVFPRYHLPTMLEEARAQFADLLGN
jgi:acyl-CoA dehydrogenase